MNRERVWFRGFLAAWSVALFALCAWFASHSSSAPVVLNRYSTQYFVIVAGTALVAVLSLLVHVPLFFRPLFRLRREFLLLILSGLLVLLVLEAALRVFDPLGLWFFRESTRYHLDKIADPVLVYKHRPHIEERYQGVAVSTNEIGLRDRPLAKPTRSELQILLLGDSVTFGWGVPIEATFGRQLEPLLASRLGRDVRTVNSGVGSYNTVQQYAFLETYHKAIEPDVVVLLYVSNDIEPNDHPFDPWSQLSPIGKSPPEVLVLNIRKSWLLWLGVFTLASLRPPEAALLNRDSRGFKESMAALSAIGGFCRDRGIDFVTIFYRRKSQSRLDALLAEVQRVGEREKFAVVDVGPWWRDADMRALRNSVIDPHPNARGHAILAHGVANALIDTGALGRTHRGSLADQWSFGGDHLRRGLRRTTW